MASLQEEVETEQGWVRGQTLKTESGQDFLSVEGLPYAEPPVEALRWKPPIPAKAWQGVRDCTAPGNVCPQVVIFTSILTSIFTSKLPLSSVVTSPLSLGGAGGPLWQLHLQYDWF